jgi:hypothetical protein
MPLANKQILTLIRSKLINNSYTSPLKDTLNKNTL